jgi:hypothetical protein
MYILKFSYWLNSKRSCRGDSCIGSTEVTMPTVLLRGYTYQTDRLNCGCTKVVGCLNIHSLPCVWNLYVWLNVKIIIDKKKNMWLTKSNLNWYLSLHVITYCTTQSVSNFRYMTSEMEMYIPSNTTMQRILVYTMLHVSAYILAVIRHLLITIQLCVSYSYFLCYMLIVCTHYM